jgi:hypothetical protein
MSYAPQTKIDYVVTTPHEITTARVTTCVFAPVSMQ